LHGLGFREIGRTKESLAFEAPDGRRIIIRRANENGHIPEIIVADAFDTAGVTMPKWHVFWCD
jgi:hypothetical protein